MKLLLLFVLFLPVSMVAQKIALIDRGFKRPILFTDSATTEDIINDYFPVHIEDLKSVLKTTDWFISAIDAGGTQIKDVSNVPAGKSTFYYSESVARKYAFHNIVLSTSTSGFSTSLKLVRFDDSRKRAIQKLLIFTDYIKNNLAVADEVSKLY
ncbi:hypothetical protein OCK74_19520 [Chitinophagaceae bacterium LB-8]|jgi:hypothetical protein|uniref:Uncharacterized protein n=1 Tax=Paraflavisolibacter caeni TaxID=2982496 RepID=A0A9X2XXQ7_9BACT|nr:hypothetical protein [Paraflavisolibacter caeni]MCU7551321.1 hypothetical protein [Paraflavisolibacter caeni]